MKSSDAIADAIDVEPVDGEPTDRAIHALAELLIEAALTELALTQETPGGPQHEQQ